MIEPLLEAERAMSFGLIDQAERLYRQVAEHDPKNAIAVMGLARVALERGDDRTAYVEARRALDIDPENPAAQHLVMRLEEVMEARGETAPEVAARSTEPEAREPRPEVSSAPRPGASAPPPSPTPPAPAAPTPRPRKRRGIVDRLLGRK